MMSETLQKETISEITSTSQELQLLSTNILNWIKYQNENRRLVKENFNVHELVNQVYSVLGSFANLKKIELVNETAATLVIHQYFEPLKIIIYNLISNAINFTDNGKIVVNTITNGDELIIKVKDHGIGMTTEQIQNIMADQYIISSSKKDNRKGNGLGYLIIKDLLKMMGAHYRITSEKGIGTEVDVIIPSEKS
jgi:signal transduction histidine kinase